MFSAMVMMLVLLETTVPDSAGAAMEVIKAALSSLQTQALAIIPVAIGISLLPFAAKWLFRKAKSLVS